MKSKNRRRYWNGWTLVELMITVAIVGIIGAIAVPSYVSYIQESRRQAAQNDLLQMKLRQESYRLDNNSYATSAQLGAPVSEHYTYSVSNISATSYTLTATAKGSQTKDTACKVITLDQSMTKTPSVCW
ncbi:type IV pilin protein [Alteromonas hispanica]|uniref:Prepilin-type N-terminal cleavage/methylation domain-containing protein n=1 Tax=Alteromonas hispanica TaxID=315421 RepID=A0A6L9MXJ4_9ALTE|nr:type IV pilin protein [Alteromonas hispanica]NDW22989.1 prepilin-type N-terminal cleavage/methylation domain-containing protein [Alteromonas hispanica]